MTLSVVSSEKPISQFAQEYIQQTRLYDAQTQLVRNFLEQQAHQIATALAQSAPQIRFQLPDQVVVSPDSGETQFVPENLRRQTAGHRFDSMARTRKLLALIQLLAELAHSEEPALAVSAGLLRYATAGTMIHQLLPEGHAVLYTTTEGDDIPSVPVAATVSYASALTASSDALIQDHFSDTDQVQVPYVPAARRFYLPQWVAFDENDHLLTNTVKEAEADIASMQNCLRILNDAISITPCMVADEIYQRKRAGILGQLINQGRALARYYTGEIIYTIRQRAVNDALNRGLWLSLPYFDDQDLTLKEYPIHVIPGGRIMFISAFVVRAMRLEQSRLARNMRLPPSTRRNLLAQLTMIEQAFSSEPIQ